MSRNTPYTSGYHKWMRASKVSQTGRKARSHPVAVSNVGEFHYTTNVPTLISLGSSLGGMMQLGLSSVQLEKVRVSDEPGFGTTDYCCTFTT